MGDAEPLVSVITPVYNGEPYLEECIESVVAQTHGNWEYSIVNNCSTDRTLEIAQRYAEKDRRIRVVTNREFVDVVENHNIAFRLIAEKSKYCKLVSADDWIYPECIAKLVELADRVDAVGIVGSYSILGGGVKYPGLPLDATVFSGRQVCRNFLLGSIDVFGSPTTVLYRSSLVRSSGSFFPTSSPSADIGACLVSLRSCDFGFVHQILSFERIHDAAVSAGLEEFNSFFVDRLEFVKEYGPLFLTRDEIEGRMEELLPIYYRFLAEGVFKLRKKEFWKYHRKRLEKFGRPLFGARLAKAVGLKFLDLALNPKATFEKVLRRLVPARPRARRRWTP